MIDESLITHIQYVLDDAEGSAVDISKGKLKELLDNYVTMIESDAELRKRLAKFNTAFNAIGRHIQKSQHSFCMGGVDSDDEFSSASKIIEYIEKIEGKDKVKNWIPL